MPTTAAQDAEHQAVVAYYRTVGPTLLDHLIARPVIGLGGGRAHSHHGVALHIADSADLDEAVRSGVVGFWLPDWARPDRLALRIRAGEDSGIDTVATTALALMELIRAAGGRVTAMLDGAGGLYLAGGGADSSTAAGFAGELADRSPEIATTSAADTAGRALIEPLRPGGDGMPSPYSLVDGPAGLAVIVPLTWDEVAAATAGMPLDIRTAEVAERIRTRGDLALELAGAIGA